MIRAHKMKICFVFFFNQCFSFKRMDKLNSREHSSDEGSNCLNGTVTHWAVQARCADSLPPTVSHWVFAVARALHPLKPSLCPFCSHCHFRPHHRHHHGHPFLFLTHSPHLKVNQFLSILRPAFFSNLPLLAHPYSHGLRAVPYYFYPQIPASSFNPYT